MGGQSLFEPGMIVSHPDQPDWGLGQVQSSVAGRGTVNFQEQGKVVIDETNVSYGLCPLVSVHGWIVFSRSEDNKRCVDADVKFGRDCDCSPTPMQRNVPL